MNTKLALHLKERTNAALMDIGMMVAKHFASKKCIYFLTQVGEHLNSEGITGTIQITSSLADRLEQAVLESVFNGGSSFTYDVNLGEVNTDGDVEYVSERCTFHVSYKCDNKINTLNTKIEITCDFLDNVKNVPLVNTSGISVVNSIETTMFSMSFYNAFNQINLMSEYGILLAKPDQKALDDMADIILDHLPSPDNSSWASSYGSLEDLNKAIDENVVRQLKFGGAIRSPLHFVLSRSFKTDQLVKVWLGNIPDGSISIDHCEGYGYYNATFSELFPSLYDCLSQSVLVEKSGLDVNELQFFFKRDHKLENIDLPHKGTFVVFTKVHDVEYVVFKTIY